MATGESESTVFVVDDDPSFCRLAAATLSGAGLSVRCFTDPAAFLQEADTPGAVCLLLNFAMPRLNGIEVFRTLRERGRCWPVVFVTAAADVPLAVQAMKLGAWDFLQKPCPASRLVSVAQAALNRAEELAAVQQAQRQIEGRWRGLTDREREVCQHLAEGAPTKDVAHRLGLHAKTIEYHRTRAYRKLGIGNVVQLARLSRAPHCMQLCCGPGAWSTPHSSL